MREHQRALQTRCVCVLLRERSAEHTTMLECSSELQKSNWTLQRSSTPVGCVQEHVGLITAGRCRRASPDTTRGEWKVENNGRTAAEGQILCSRPAAFVAQRACVCMHGALATHLQVIISRADLSPDAQKSYLRSAAFSEGCARRGVQWEHGVIDVVGGSHCSCVYEALCSAVRHRACSRKSKNRFWARRRVQRSARVAGCIRARGAAADALRASPACVVPSHVSRAPLVEVWGSGGCGLECVAKGTVWSDCRNVKNAIWVPARTPVGRRRASRAHGVLAVSTAPTDM